MIGAASKIVINFGSTVVVVAAEAAGSHKRRSFADSGSQEQKQLGYLHQVRIKPRRQREESEYSIDASVALMFDLNKNDPDFSQLIF